MKSAFNLEQVSIPVFKKNLHNLAKPDSSKVSAANVLNTLHTTLSNSLEPNIAMAASELYRQRGCKMVDEQAQDKTSRNQAHKLPRSLVMDQAHHHNKPELHLVSQVLLETVDQAVCPVFGYMNLLDRGESKKVDRAEGC